MNHIWPSLKGRDKNDPLSYGRGHVRWSPHSLEQSKIPNDSAHLNINAIEHILYCWDCQKRISEEEKRVEQLETI